MKNIVIVGGGYSGLASAYYLKDQPNCKVTILEGSDKLGGLAFAFREKEWKWSIEKYIHHWFSNDRYILDIAKEMGISSKLVLKDTKSSIFYNGKIAEMDSAVSLLKFPFLSVYDRIRMGLAMALIKLDKNFIDKEKETAFDFIKRTMGEDAFKVVWEPLFYGKFGKHAPKINAAWFCGRIQARTKKLMYVEGGFEDFTKAIAENIKKSGQEILLNCPVKKIVKKGEKFEVSYGNKKIIADYVVLALPLPISLKLFDFNKEFMERYSDLVSIGSQYFVLELDKPFLEDGTYWLNVNDKESPFMMLAEHTNFVDKSNYNGKSMVWIGKYLDYDHPLWQLSEKDLLKKVVEYMKKIKPKFDEKTINRHFFFREKNTQHITPINYSKKIPRLFTGTDGMYMANINQIYPFDRATNHSIRIGKNVAGMIKQDISTKHKRI